MGKGRLEAFSDGVIAVIITIMVLELKVPHGSNLAALNPVIPVFLTYVLSFIFVGIYWNNHHHMLHAVHSVNGSILWANLHLLFWLSLTPFATAWMGENYTVSQPVALYGALLLMCAIAYTILARALVAHEGADSALAKALGRDFKGQVSLAIYVIAIPISFARPWLAIALYAVVALMWLIPDRRIEKVIAE
jgi:TMEM175 potassium channel family protein